jgi:hypothetical protein
MRVKKNEASGGVKKNARKRFVICAATGKEPRGLVEYIQRIHTYPEVDTMIVAIAQDNSVKSRKVRYGWDIFIRGLGAMIEFIHNDIIPAARAEPNRINVVIIVDGWTNPALLIALLKALVENSVKFSASPMDHSRAEWLWIYWCPTPKEQPKKAGNGGA